MPSSTKVKVSGDAYGFEPIWMEDTLVRIELI